MPTATLSFVDRFARLQDYEAWSGGLVVNSVQTAERTLLSQASRIGIPAADIYDKYARAVSTFGHIQWARRLWLSRISRCDPPPDVMPSKEWPISRLGEESRTLDGLWTKYLAGLKDSDLGRKVEYRTTEGKDQSGTLIDILTHVFNHSAYHRGQIAMLVRQCGGDPAATDFIFFCRETGS